MNRPASLVLLATLLVSACGGAAPSSAPTAAPTASGQAGQDGLDATYDVTYSEGTSVVDSAAYESALLAAPNPAAAADGSDGTYRLRAPIGRLPSSPVRS